jgi:hypothetical protein
MTDSDEKDLERRLLWLARRLAAAVHSPIKSRNLARSLVDQKWLPELASNLLVFDRIAPAALSLEEEVAGLHRDQTLEAAARYDRFEKRLANEKSENSRSLNKSAKCIISA